MTKNTASGDRS